MSSILVQGIVGGLLLDAVYALFSSGLTLVWGMMRGPMLAQVFGTFGLALLLRYSVFWWFGANFLSLPGNIVGGTFDILGLRLQASRLLAGGAALLVTLGLHVLLTRTSLRSKMLGGGR